jgi:hypothetical protein
VPGRGSVTFLGGSSGRSGVIRASQLA